ncbi:hypothetical protein HPY31_19490 [Brevibacillus sp. HB1.3]|nr:hypothetical protein [Brevibacillus sp. HB1.3]
MENIGKDDWDFREFKGRNSIDLLARFIHSEAENQSIEGVILKEGAFDGMNLAKVRKPDLESESWQEALDIARNLKDTPNSIGNCLKTTGLSFCKMVEEQKFVR